MRKSLLAAVCLLLSTVVAGQSRPLFGPNGVSTDGVRQGSVGSCNFHSVISALASTNPDALKTAITEIAPGEYDVRFADGTTEHVTAAEAQAAIDSGYDDSDGLWVSVLFRGFAHRILRKSLLDAVNTSAMVPLAKYGATMLVNSNDFALLAYDRAVRSQIKPDGSIDRAALRARLQEELKATPLSPDLGARVLDAIDTQGFFDGLAADVQSNGEIFGAYHSPKQGGLPHRVFEAFYGPASDASIAPDSHFENALQASLEAHLPATAMTRTGDPVAAIPGASMWYVNSHAYTVLGFDTEKKMVTLRNPWGEHPAPDGRFSIPLETFRAAFESICLGDRR